MQEQQNLSEKDDTPVRAFAFAGVATSVSNAAAAHSSAESQNAIVDAALSDPKRALAKIQSDLARRNWRNVVFWLRRLESAQDFMPTDMLRQVVASAVAKGARAWCDEGDQKTFFDIVEASPFWRETALGWARRKDGELPMGHSPQMLHYLSALMKGVPEEERAQIWFRTAMAGAKAASPGPVWTALRQVGPENGFSEAQKRAILKSWAHGAMAAPLLTAQAHYPATLNALESLGLAHESGYLNQITTCLKDLPPPDEKTEKHESSAAFVAQELIERIPERKAAEAGVRARYWLELVKWRACANEKNWEIWTPVENAVQARIQKARDLAFPAAAIGEISELSTMNMAEKLRAEVAPPAEHKKAGGPRRFGR